MTKKVSNFMRFMSGFLVLVLCLTSIPEIRAKAAEATVDLVGDSIEASSGLVRNGVSYLQTGYLCYLLTADGNAVAGTRAYAFKCPSFVEITEGGEPIFRATSRKGGYVAHMQI